MKLNSANPHPERTALAPDDLLKLRFVRDAQLSPDAKTAATILSRPDRPGDDDFLELVLIDTTSGIQQELVAGDLRVSGPSWSPTGSKLAYIRLDGQAPRVCVHSLDNDEVTEIPVSGGMPQPPLAWSPDGGKIAVTVTTVDPPGSGLQRITTKGYRIEGVGDVAALHQRIDVIDLAAGTVTCVTHGLGNCSQPAFSPTGDRLLFGAIAGAALPAGGSAPMPHIIDLASGQITKVLDEADWYVQEAQWLPDGKRLLIFGAYRSNMTAPVGILYTFDLATGTHDCRTPDLTVQIGMRVHEDTPIWEICFSRGLEIVDRSTAYVTVQAGGEVQIWRVALEGAVRIEPVVQGPRSCLLLGAAGDALLFLASDVHHPADLYFRSDAGDERRLSALNDAVFADWPKLALRHLPVTSPDGLELDAWYLAPADADGPLPTIMFIHGGPFLAIGNAFRYDFHMLASRGWGIVFGNFRGSAGYGEAFQRKIIGDWGAKGYPDHMAVIDAAIAAGLADPEHLGVWGASHGGFATAWIVGHTNRFRAAVAEAAATNFLSLYYLSDLGAVLAVDLGGLPHEIPDIYRSRSPLTFAHRCTTPTLMLHGAEDNRFPITEAEQFFQLLLDIGCTTELVRIPRCSHMGDSYGPLSARIGQNEALVDWFERFL